MDLICYLLGDWQPIIRPAEPTRDWMDATRSGFAYRCLPLNIANAHGWEILTPVGFSAYWNGGTRPQDVIIHRDKDMPPLAAPFSSFGEAILTIPVQGLFRTPPGWDLWVSGSPNTAKEGVAPISGIVETDWSHSSFTLNWQFLRRNHRVRFEAGEPVGFIMPVLRGALERMDPKFIMLEENPELYRQHMAWRENRPRFLATVKPSSKQSERWTKRYYVGENMDGKKQPDHRSKVRLKPFVPGAPTKPVETVMMNAGRLKAAMREAGLSSDAVDGIIEQAS